jgi:hypothetical protein
MEQRLGLGWLTRVKAEGKRQKAEGGSAAGHDRRDRQNPMIWAWGLQTPGNIDFQTEIQPSEL